MILGICGMYATGKTTFVNKRMDDMADFQPNICIAFADVASEYWLRDNEWVKIYNYDDWKSTNDKKLARLDRMVGDRKTYYVIESARYFGGLAPHLLPIIQKYGGGVKFICITTRPATGKLFIKERCETNGKEFNEAYWSDAVKLDYECRNRHINQMEKYYGPAGVEYVEYMMDYQRFVWVEEVLPHILSWLQLPAKDWYNLKAVVARKEVSNESVGLNPARITRKPKR